MWMTLTLAILWLIGAAVPVGREDLTFSERLVHPLSLFVGFFVVSIALQVIGAATFFIGLVADTIIGLF